MQGFFEPVYEGGPWPRFEPAFVYVGNHEGNAIAERM
jgi:hypothetical protein